MAGGLLGRRRQLEFPVGVRERGRAAQVRRPERKAALPQRREGDGGERDPPEGRLETDFLPEKTAGRPASVSRAAATSRRSVQSIMSAQSLNAR